MRRRAKPHQRYNAPAVGCRLARRLARSRGDRTTAENWTICRCGAVWRQCERSGAVIRSTAGFRRKPAYNQNNALPVRGLPMSERKHFVWLSPHSRTGCGADCISSPFWRKGKQPELPGLSYRTSDRGCHGTSAAVTSRSSGRFRSKRPRESRRSPNGKNRSIIAMSGTPIARASPAGCPRHPISAEERR